LLRFSEPKKQQAWYVVFGKHYARTFHVKSLIIDISFTSAERAGALGKAALSIAAAVPIVIRDSVFDGIPDFPDNIDEANPHGVAIKFRADGDADLDVVTVDFNDFPTATANDFGLLLRAIALSAPEATKLTVLVVFPDGHPIAKTFLTTQNMPPVSYATMAYVGVNSDSFFNARSERHFVRHWFVSRAGEYYLDEAGRELANLTEEIAKRISAGVIRLDWDFGSWQSL
jgi:catalase